MLRAVLDTNVVVSALLKRSGLENYVLRLGLGGAVKLSTSPAVFAEYASVLARPRLKLNTEEIRIILEQLRKESNRYIRLKRLPYAPMSRTIDFSNAPRQQSTLSYNRQHAPLPTRVEGNSRRECEGVYRIFRCTAELIAIMRKQLKRKRRSCSLCKPHKTGHVTR